MTVLEVLKMELKGLRGYEDNELLVYLENNDLAHSDKYNKSMRIQILRTALDVLSSMANNQSYFANKQHEDLNISDFATNLQNRIDQLTIQIRKLKAEQSNSSTFVMFRE
ncbi:hypothetical protein [Ornithinibacillus sp. 179-J 7C1 HS]|uniref:hypothetical protein n=1 Tax=Ornithinibacillus sp. 179-J 7C1 HS TaxID=3142384 RepID=UPI0039A25001